MSKLNASDIQGFTLRGYNLPFARYLFLHFEDATAARMLIGQLLGMITTGQRWDNGKPQNTLNIAFTQGGLAALDLPEATLLSFPVEFQQGMRARAAILGDTGRNDPANWETMWQDGRVHAWLGINGQSVAALDSCHAQITALLTATGAATVVGRQEAAAVQIDGQPTTKEHFGYTDGFGNPDYLGIERSTQPGQGKLSKDGKTWLPLATGELLLGYADEAGELPVAPVPHILAANGTFMAYRKLRQNVAAFRAYLDQQAPFYAGGREKLAAKFIGRWRDGTPLELSPDRGDLSIVNDPQKNTDFIYTTDPDGTRCKCRNSQTHTLQATRFGSSHTSSMLHAAMHALCCCRMATAPGLSIGQQTACCEPAGWGATGMAIKCQLGSVISAPLLTHINSAPVTPKGNDRATSAAFVPLSVNPPLREVLPWEYPAACL